MTSELRVRGVMRGVLLLYRRLGLLLIPLAAGIAVVTGAVNEAARSASPAASLLTIPTDAIGTAILSGIAVVLVADIHDGRGQATLAHVVRSVRPRVGQLSLVTAAASVMESIGLIFLIVPGLYLLTIWAVYAPVVVLEHGPGLRSLDRSRELVQGNMWRVFVVVVMTVVIVPVLGLTIAFADRSAAAVIRLAATVVVGASVLPIPALASAVLYFELQGSAIEPSAAAAAS